MTPTEEYVVHSFSRCLAVLVALLVPTTIALAAAPSTDSKVIARWDFENGTDGWEPVRHCELSAADGVLTINSVGDDPHLAVDVEAAAGWKEFSFRAKFTGRNAGQIFWTTAQSAETSEDRSVRFEI